MRELEERFPDEVDEDETRGSQRTNILSNSIVVFVLARQVRLCTRFVLARSESGAELRTIFLGTNCRVQIVG